MKKTNRLLPFGYQIKDGKIVFAPQETIEVKKIFMSYKAGMSYQMIADDLTNRKVYYLENRCGWNKNRVKRILENIKYTGTADLPPIIATGEYETIQRIIKEKTLGNRETPKEIKQLKGFLVCEECGAKLSRYMTHKRDVWKCPNRNCNISITNLELTKQMEILYQSLKKNQDMIDIPKEEQNATDDETEWLVTSFRMELSSPNLNEEKAKQLIMSYVLAQYSRVDSGENSRKILEIKAVLNNVESTESIVDSIVQIVDYLIIKKDKSLGIMLKTGKRL